MTDEHNEGFRVLDDFVCDAIPGIDAPRANRIKPGGSEGFPSVRDHSVDAVAANEDKDGQAPPATNKTPNLRDTA